MGKIESSIGSREFETRQEKRFVVDDMSQGFPDGKDVMEAELNEISPADLTRLRQERLQSVNKVTSSVKQRVELLLGLGRAYTDVEVESENGKVAFTLSTLKSKESERVTRESYEHANRSTAEYLFAVRKWTLAFALCAVEGADVDAYLGVVGEKYEDKILARIELLENLDETVVNHIFSKHEALVNRNKAKYPITQEEIKEVAESIKKSS